MGIFDDLFGSSGDPSGDASSEYQKWAEKAIEEYKQSEQQGRGDITQGFQQGLGFEQPYMQAGQAALGSYMGTLGLGDRQGALDRFQTSPGYKFAMQQGNQAIQRQGAASGLTGSGAESKELMKYGQGMANQEYGQYQSRLAQMAGQGQQMAGLAGGQAMQTGQSLANLGRGYSEDIGGAYQGIGQSSANSILAQYMADQQRIAGEWGAIGKLGGAAIGAFGQPGGTGGTGGAAGGGF